MPPPSWGLIASLYIGNVLLLVLNLPLVGLWVRLLTIPQHWLYAGILMCASLGTYTLNNNSFDLVILWVIGLLGFGLRVIGVPVVPVVLGLILGPMLEQQLRRALAISQGDPTIFVTRPMSLALLALALALIVVPTVLQFRRELDRRRNAAAALPGAAVE